MEWWGFGTGCRDGAGSVGLVQQRAEQFLRINWTCFVAVAVRFSDGFIISMQGLSPDVIDQTCGAMRGALYSNGTLRLCSLPTWNMKAPTLISLQVGLGIPQLRAGEKLLNMFIPAAGGS